MTVKKLNPESTILQQLDGEWPKMALLLLWKLAGRNQVKLTAAEIENCINEFSPGVPVIYTHGHKDSIDFQLVDEDTAQRLATHDATMKGNA